METNNGTLLREMGNKLANFRKKLAVASGLKKITQPQFGQMFGGYTKREINSYETGAVGIPGRLFYLIWKSGNSIDGIFGERDIGEKGRDVARELSYEPPVTPSELLDVAHSKGRSGTSKAFEEDESRGPHSAQKEGFDTAKPGAAKKRRS
jgi:hypothetical protein